MKLLAILMKKEWMEISRSGKMIWVPVAFIILAISQPLSMYYMPQLLDVAGGLPEGANIDFPTPAGEEVLAGVLSQFGLVGTLLFVLAGMTVIANERNSGAVTFVFIRPVQPYQYILSKWISLFALYVLSFFLSYGLSWYYTIEMFSYISLGELLNSFLLYSVWIGFVAALTICFNALLKGGGGIAGGSLAVLALLGFAQMLVPEFMRWSPTQVHQLASDVLLTSHSFSEVLLPLLITILLTIGLLIVATFRIRV